MSAAEGCTYSDVKGKIQTDSPFHYIMAVYLKGLKQ